MNKKRREQDKEMLKSLYKYMLKNYGKTASSGSKHSKYGKASKTVVEDVLDDNFEAEANPGSIPVRKPGVLRKAKGEEKQRRKTMGSKASEVRRKAHMATGTMKDGKKFTYPNDPRSGHRYGINKPYRENDPGTSVVGHHIKEKTNPVIPVKEQMRDKIQHLKNAPKPNLPKNEQMNKARAPQPSRAQKIRKPSQLTQRPRVKGVKRLKSYMKQKDNNNL